MPLFDQRRNRRWGWVLRIAGLRHVYHSGPGIPAGSLPDVWTEDGPEWVAVNAITSVGSMSERLPVIGGVVEQSPIDVTLASRGDQPTGDGDPATVFARLGVRSAGWWGQMLGVEVGLEELAVLLPEQEPVFVVYVDQDPTGLDFPRVVHVGQEAFIASAGDGDAIGGEDPWRLTISDRDRKSVV